MVTLAIQCKRVYVGSLPFKYAGHIYDVNEDVYWTFFNIESYDNLTPPVVKLLDENDYVIRYVMVVL